MSKIFYIDLIGLHPQGIYKEIFSILTNNGWCFDKDNEMMIYQKTGWDYDWGYLKSDYNVWTDLLNKAINNNEQIGIRIFWGETDIGGHLMIREDKNISFHAVINTLYNPILEEFRIPKVDWYLEKLIAPLSNYNIQIERIEIGQF